jgi:hypothetical protein
MHRAYGRSRDAALESVSGGQSLLGLDDFQGEPLLHNGRCRDHAITAALKTCDEQLSFENSKDLFWIGKPCRVHASLGNSEIF